jgi:2-succinyl-5-enolpyruvyl-6-hydroxy-3-cyclohexene-1-carboxylate synthase
LEYFVLNAKNACKNNLNYYNTWQDEVKKTKYPRFPFSSTFVIQSLLSKIPAYSLLHLGILNCVRIAEYFDLPKDTNVYANIGTYGIDGGMSTFLGQASVSNRPSFLIIGDLSFFYDMNSLKIHCIKNNVHILLINNGGGSEFYYNTGKTIDPTIDLHTAARHNTHAKGWVESVDIRYLSATSEQELISQLDEFVSDNPIPVVLEVFTDMESDADIIHAFYDMNRKETKTDNLFKNVKNMAHSILGNDNFEKLKSVIK